MQGGGGKRGSMHSVAGVQTGGLPNEREVERREVECRGLNEEKG